MARCTIFDLRKAGKLKVIPYLGQDDRRLKYTPLDLVRREEAFAYPSDFFGMTPQWIDRLTRRGYQLTIALVREHAPYLLRREQPLS